ncbi:MAG: gluconate 2-dehydrogenase subunit 3 family protein [Flavipsychrobacter sp.]|nr:gluconate 2-dehydrogenase subunit 3 family protein [Flavipsychrobacter sp.]
MDRRKSLKALALGTLSTGLLLDACKETDKKADAPKTDIAGTGKIDRMPEEVDHYNKITADKFFTDHEMATITILADIIIPKDEVSGSASDAKVPDFIEFIVKDMPEHQTPMRGGLRWLDLQCLRQFEKSFKDCSEQQKIAMVDQIAYPDKAKAEMKPGVNFFNLMRDLTCTGFYTSEIGVKDIGYAGNKPNQWNGVPEDVLNQYKLAYTEKENKECVSYK